VRIEDYERPRGRGVGDDFERAQELGGDDTIGSRDGFRAGQDDNDGRLELLGVFPGYLSHSIWVFWDAIREFDPAKRKLHNPHPLGALIWQIAKRRSRHALASLPHGLARYGPRIKDDRSRREQQLEVMETAFVDVMAKADAAVEIFLNITSNVRDATVLRMWWPSPCDHGRPAAIHAAEIARQLGVHRSIISRRLHRIRRQLIDLDHALVVWEAIDAYSRRQVDWTELATNEKLAGIINREGVVTPLVRTDRQAPPLQPSSSDSIMESHVQTVTVETFLKGGCPWQP
jgi:hypothetical protein